MSAPTAQVACTGGLRTVYALQDYAGKLKIVKVEHDANKELITKYRVRGALNPDCSLLHLMVCV